LLRPAPGKSNLILIDHSGAVYRHGLLEDPVAWSLDVTKRAENPTHAKRDQQKISRLVECSQCGALRTGGEACPHCGFLPKRRPDAIIFAEGDLARVDRNTGMPVRSSDPHERMRWHAELSFIAAQRGYRAGWVAHKYKEKFGAWPAVRAIEPRRPSPEVLSWVRSRIIAFAKASQKATAA
jgi:DNA repair protein RadD